MALLRKRLDELKEMSLKMRSTSVLIDNAEMGGHDEIRRIALSLARLERELRRLQRKNEKDREEVLYGKQSEATG
jgi:hypothetical protein